MTQRESCCRFVLLRSRLIILLLCAKLVDFDSSKSWTHKKQRWHYDIKANIELVYYLSIHPTYLDINAKLINSFQSHPIVHITYVYMQMHCIALRDLPMPFGTKDRYVYSFSSVFLSRESLSIYKVNRNIIASSNK